MSNFVHSQKLGDMGQNNIGKTDDSFFRHFFTSFLTNSLDSIMILNPDQTIRHVNDAFEITYGWAKHEVLFQTIPFIPESHADEFQSLIQAALDGKSISSYEIACLRKDGSLFDISLTLTPIHDDSGTLLALLILARDITERKKYVEELRLTNEHLQYFLTNTSDAIGIFDLHSRVIRINQATLDIFGYTTEEMLGKEVQTLPSPEYREEVANLHRRVRSGENIKGYETIRKHKNGSLVDVSISYSPIRNADGEVIAFANILRDITESKRVEKALRENEIKFRLIAENMFDMIRIIDVKGIVMYASPSHQTVLGIAPDQVEGTSSFLNVHSEDLEKVTNLFDEMLTNWQPVTLDLRYLHQNGEWLVLECRCKPMLDSSGKVEQIICVARDITERIQTEELLRNSDKLSIIGQLAAGIAHEIRNPLTSIRGFIQLMQEQSTLKHEYLEIMRDELDRINMIVSELLVLSKPQIIHYKKNNLPSILTNVLMLLDTQAIMNNVQIQLVLDDSLPDIVCEANQVKQVFINIIKNAIDAMPQGGIIQIRMHGVDDRFIMIQINDQGCGVSQERLSQLGLPFYSTKEKGTGLGLMISKKIIRDHNGDLSFKSRLHEGTTVEILLPIDPL
ncbi:PAS domain S-box protein [Brevibacillus ginsengisoli]|uniref:PAS domain-containing sensor histidine kinase n=1 Tax=Brevibacillus ginsengisoli TaxID=363854 RepID=UPI003CF3FFDD